MRRGVEERCGGEVVRRSKGGRQGFEMPCSGGGHWAIVEVVRRGDEVMRRGDEVVRRGDEEKW